jgi:hypothetical protein
MNLYEQLLGHLWVLDIIQRLIKLSESQPGNLVKNSDHANHCEPCLFNDYQLTGISPVDHCRQFRRHWCKPKGSSIFPSNPDAV